MFLQIIFAALAALITITTGTAHQRKLIRESDADTAEVVYNEALRLAQKKYNLRNPPAKVIIDEWMNALENILMKEREADMAAVRLYEAAANRSAFIKQCVVLVLLFVFICICYRVYRSRYWREDIIHLFDLHEDASTLGVCLEILSCIGIRLLQLISGVLQLIAGILGKLGSSLWWVITPFRWALVWLLSAIFRPIERAITWTSEQCHEAALDWQDSEFRHTCIYYKIRIRQALSVENILYFYAFCCLAVLAVLAIKETKPWEPVLLRLRALKMHLEPIPEDVLRPKSSATFAAPFTAPPTAISTAISTSPATSHRDQSPLLRDVPTARIIGMDVPIVVPDPMTGMRLPQGSYKSGRKTIIAGRQQVYCSKCKQWHCCEVPY